MGSMMSSCIRNSCAKDDTIGFNAKSTFFGDQDTEKSESTLSRSLFLNEYTSVDNLDVDNQDVDNQDVDNQDRPHSL